jgi:hypothetical protein
MEVNYLMVPIQNWLNKKLDSEMTFRADAEN